MKSMRIWKIILISLILGGLIILLLSCTSEPKESELLENQVVSVQRGDLTVDIISAGNLVLSHTEDLTFDLFYEEGTVEEVLVEEGDTVEEGQVLVRLDTEEWEDELTALEDQVTAEERDLLQKEINLINAENDLEDAEDAWLETDSVGRKIIRLEQRLEFYLELNDPDDDDVEKINEIKQELEWRWNEFYRVASDSDEVTIKEMALELANGQLEDAQNALQDAQEELDEAKSKSSIIVAPFSGFITMINVEGGDTVMKGTVAVELADPNKFEADIMVSEMDILQVELGGEAWVQVDAMQGLSLPAEVTHISPTATIQSGVVNYEVKVEVASLEELIQEQQAARQEAIENIQQGELPEYLQQAIEAGEITQEEAEQKMQQGQVPTAMPEGFQLREGLTVTVSIIVDERNDVLLVPNAAITTQGRQTYVQVMSQGGAIEERSITTGISDWQYTEVTEGLSEGEQVVVPQGTITTSATEQGPPGGMWIPGMGGAPH